MKRFRKIAALFISVAMTAALFVGCDTDEAPAAEGSGIFGPHGIEYAVDQTLRFIYGTEATSLNPFSVADSLANWEAVFNGTAALTRADEFGLVGPGLAYRWEMSEDGLRWRFFIREGVQWVDHTITPVGELTADCFVAVMEWVMDPVNLSANRGDFFGRIKNAEEFYLGYVGLDEVGFRAVDRYILEIELSMPTPYFLERASFQPAYRPFLEEMGRYYGTNIDTKLFIGPFVMTEFSPGFRRVWERNPYFWRAEGVYLDRVIGTFNAEANLLAPELFMRGEIDHAQIPTEVIDSWMANPATNYFICPGVPNHDFQWYFMFNFDPNFDERFEPDNWELAVNNTAFRQSIFWGIDSLRALRTLDPFNAEIYLSNTITPRGFAVVEGVDYVDMAPLSRFHEYPNFLFYPERALAYRDQAIEELTAQGATFPIIMLMRYNPVTPQAWPDEVQVVAQQLVELLGPEYLQPYILTGPSVGFLVDIRRDGNYAFMKGNNGVVAPGDPASWIWAFAERGVDDVWDNWIRWSTASGEETQRIFEEYQALIRYARTHTTRSLERFQAFNEAEYFLTSNAIVRPYYTIGAGYFVFRANPFAISGNGGQLTGWEGRRLLTQPLTTEQWTLIHDDWQAERARRIAETGAVPVSGW